MLKGIIFDMDGTLLDTIGSIANACNHVLGHYGYPTHESEAYKAFVGCGLTKSIFNALPPENQEGLKRDRMPVTEHPHLLEMVDMLESYYQLNPTQDTKFYDGIEDLLKFLSQQNILWGIHTNKSHRVASKVADAFFDPDTYLDIFGPSDHMPRKPNPKGTYKLIELMEETGISVQASELLFVGDTEVDIETAKGLNIPVVAVTWGFRSKSNLEKLKPDYLVDSPAELIELIKTLK